MKAKDQEFGARFISKENACGLELDYIGIGHL